MNQDEERHYTLHDAGQRDIPSLVQMRVKLQAHIKSRNGAAWDFNGQKIQRLGEFYAKKIESHACKILIVRAEPSAAPIGMCLGSVCQNEDFIPSIYGRIDDVWIEPEHRRRGLCKQVVAEMMVFFQSNGVEEVILDFLHGNTEAEQTWEHLGFKPVLITASAKVGSGSSVWNS